MNVHIYGIKNCDTMKKAFAWLDAHKVSYEFHDYKKSGVDVEVLKKAIEQHGWENVINRKGTSWRALPDDVKASMDADAALAAAIKSPSLIKRPLMIWGNDIHLGFSEDVYKALHSSLR